MVRQIIEIQKSHNTISGLAKVAIQCFYESFL